MEPTHSDARRDLFSYPEAKLIVAKEDTVIGKHYHKLKEEIFILSSGKCTVFFSANPIRVGTEMKPGELHRVPPGIYHEFHLTKGSVLIGLNSCPYDASDDYRLEPISESSESK